MLIIAEEVEAGAESRDGDTERRDRRKDREGGGREREKRRG